MRLAKNFTLEELCVTNTGLPNVPNEEQKCKLLYLASYILQPIRDQFGPVIIGSGFRSEEVNKKIGGSSTSQHRYGEAADFIPAAGLEVVFDWAKKYLTFGQLIFEEARGSRWIHVSLPRLYKPKDIMTYKNGVYQKVA
jgi:zinc D-Ala-D-Ala carboxypeptidase